jgi:hypothetical protein
MARGLSHDAHVKRLASLYTPGVLWAMLRFARADGAEASWVARLSDAYDEASITEAMHRVVA